MIVDIKKPHAIICFSMCVQVGSEIIKPSQQKKHADNIQSYHCFVFQTV